MTLWNLFAGSFTKEFVDVFERLRTSDNPWERDWVAGGTQSSGWRPDVAAPSKRARYSEGVERFVFDDASGEIHPAGVITGDVVNPQYLTRHPHLPVIYAVEYAQAGRLLALPMDAIESVTTHLSTSTLGDLAIAASVHPSGRCAYVAHWGDGTLARIHLDNSGYPTDAEVVVEGSSRPGTPHFSRLHHVRVSQAGDVVMVTDVGRDEMTLYACDSAGRVDPSPIARIEFPSRSGPRHIEFHPSGRWAYVVTERSSTLHVLEAHQGVPQRIAGTYQTVPTDYERNNRPSECRVHPSGHLLFVGNRGFDALSVFSVGAQGDLRAVAYVPSPGRNFSCLAVDPSGQYVLAGNVIPGNIAVFRLDGRGNPRRVGLPVQAAAPRSLTFGGCVRP